MWDGKGCVMICGIWDGIWDGKGLGMGCGIRWDVGLVVWGGLMVTFCYVETFNILQPEPSLSLLYYLGLILEPKSATEWIYGQCTVS